jgi:hypothetical protein
MASCIVENAVTGALELTTDSAEACTGYLVLDSAEYTQMQLFSAAFEVPTVVQLQELFLWSFGLVVIPYLVAWAYQTVIDFASADEHY